MRTQTRGLDGKMGLTLIFLAHLEGAIHELKLAARDTDIIMSANEARQFENKIFELEELEIDFEKRLRR